MRLTLFIAKIAAFLAFGCGGRAQESARKGVDDPNALSGRSSGSTEGSGGTGAVSSGGADTLGSGGHLVEPSEVGHVDTSCGAYMRSLDDETFLDCRVGGEHEFHPECILVDCTAHGDVNAGCVFSNHCFCSEGFTCEDGQTWIGAECHPRFSCVPAL